MNDMQIVETTPVDTVSVLVDGADQDLAVISTITQIQLAEVNTSFPALPFSLFDIGPVTCYYGGSINGFWQINRWVNLVKTIASLNSNSNLLNLTSAWAVRSTLVYV